MLQKLQYYTSHQTLSESYNMLPKRIDCFKICQDQGTGTNNTNYTINCDAKNNWTRK